MITKAKTTQYTSSDGKIHTTIQDAKVAELGILIGTDAMMNFTTIADALVSKPREAIAILKVGLPRKPRVVKTKGKKKPAATPENED